MFVSPSEPVTPGSLLFRGERGAFKVVPIYPILHEQSSVRSILFYKCVFQLKRKSSRMSSSYTGMEESVLMWNKHTPLFQMGKSGKEEVASLIESFLILSGNSLQEHVSCKYHVFKEWDVCFSFAK